LYSLSDDALGGDSLVDATAAVVVVVMWEVSFHFTPA